MLRPALLLPLALTLATSLATQAAQPGAADVARAREVLAHTIAVPTVAGRGEVPTLARWLAEQLRAGGFAQAELEVLPLGDTAALLARYPGKDRSLPPLVLSVHMDVVEARREDWVRDPFQLSEAEGFFFGRGVSDNKFDLSMLVVTLNALRTSGFVPARDVVLAVSGDEETTMETTKLLAARLKGAWMVVNGDLGNSPLDANHAPQAALIQAGEKTYATYRLEVTNPGGHSSLPRADNAIYQLAAALTRLGAHRFPLQFSELSRAYLRGVAPQAEPEMRAALLALAEDPGNAAAAAKVTGSTEYNAVLRTTCVATMLDGGHAENALPQRARATVNCRIHPDMQPAQVQAELARVLADPGVTITPVGEISSAPASPLRADILAALRTAVDVRFPGLPILPYMSAGATDNKHFRAAGIDSYAVTSYFMRPEDDFSHGLNERVPADAIPHALRFWDALIRALVDEP